MTTSEDTRTVAQQGLSYEHLFSIVAELNPSLDGGESSQGRRILNAVSSGTFEGRRLRGHINPGTGDWMLTRPDGTMVVDARIVLITDDGAIIHMSYGGRIVIPDDVRSEAGDREKRHLLSPSKYYFRTAPFFETGAAKYAWLNNVICVGSGRLLQGRRIAYEIFQIL